MVVLTGNTVAYNGFQAVALSKGQELPEWAVEQVGDHLLGEPADEQAQDVDHNTPDQSWKNDDIKAYADEHDIDLSDATVKADMLAVIDGS